MNGKKKATAATGPSYADLMKAKEGVHKKSGEKGWFLPNGDFMDRESYGSARRAAVAARRKNGNKVGRALSQ